MKDNSISFKSNKLGGLNASAIFKKDQSWLIPEVSKPDQEKELGEIGTSLVPFLSEILEFREKSSTTILNVEWDDLKGIQDINEFLKTHPMQVLDALNAAARKRFSFVNVVRLINFIPRTSLKDIKANIIGQFVTIQGSVVRVSSIQPKVEKMTFACIKCGSWCTLDFKDGKFNTPIKCNTFGCKGKILVPDRGYNHSTRTIDWQRVRIQEKLFDENVDAGQVPRAIDCELTEELVDSLIPGDVVSISGIVKVVSREQG